MPSIRVAVPSELADVLVAEGDAVRSPRVRGPAVETLHFVIEGLGATASIVTLVAEIEVYRRFARAVRRTAGNSHVTVEPGSDPSAAEAGDDESERAEAHAAGGRVVDPGEDEIVDLLRAQERAAGGDGR